VRNGNARYSIRLADRRQAKPNVGREPRRPKGLGAGAQRRNDGIRERPQLAREALAFRWTRTEITITARLSAADLDALCRPENSFSHIDEIFERELG